MGREEYKRVTQDEQKEQRAANGWLPIEMEDTSWYCGDNQHKTTCYTDKYMVILISLK